jgi:hypothetical protein
MEASSQQLMWSPRYIGAVVRRLVKDGRDARWRSPEPITDVNPFASALEEAASLYRRTGLLIRPVAVEDAMNVLRVTARAPDRLTVAPELSAFLQDLLSERLAPHTYVVREDVALDIFVYERFPNFPLLRNAASALFAACALHVLGHPQCPEKTQALRRAIRDVR